MKRLVLFAVMVLFIIFPLLFWARTLSFGLGLPFAIYDIGRFLSIVGFVLIFFQFVLSSKIKLIERGIGLDKLFRIHRILGVMGFASILIHPTVLLISDLLQDIRPSFTNPLKIVGAFALLLLSIAVVAAILYGKVKIRYETWENIHKVNYIVFPFAFIHSLLIGSNLKGSFPLRVFWWMLFGLYLVILGHKIWTQFSLRKNPLRVVDVSQETHDTWSLSFEGKHKDYKPGQFMIVQLVRDGRVSEPHPFTISSSPAKDRLSISVKSVGDFTSTISNTKTSDHAYIDGPYGTFSFLNYDAQSLVFIAGGIGITPFISMLRYIYDKKLERHVILIWGNKSANDIAFKEELKRMELEMSSLKVIHVMSKQDDWEGEKGYIDAEKLKRYVDDFQNSQFFVCGPPIMMNAVMKSLRGLGVPKRKIHYERFALR